MDAQYEDVENDLNYSVLFWMFEAEIRMETFLLEIAQGRGVCATLEDKESLWRLEVVVSAFSGWILNRKDNFNVKKVKIVNWFGMEIWREDSWRKNMCFQP